MTRPDQPYSRDWRARIALWFHADPPWAIRPYGGAAMIKDRIARVVRLTWRWRDVSPGIVAFAVLWLWARVPLPGPSVPEIPVAWLLGLSGALSVASLWFDSSHDRTANKDRAAHQFKRRFQKAWLDLGVDAPIPGIGRPQVRPHSTSAWVELVEGTDEWQLGRRVRQKLGNIYRAQAELIPDHKGGALLVIRHGDPLATEPELPIHLGNVEGDDLAPRWDRMPLGVDRDGDPFVVNLFEQHLLVPGQTRSGKSSTIEALGCTCLAAPNVDPWFADPQNVSLAAFRDVAPYAGNAPDALDLLEDFHRAMQKRELEMAEVGTSLATPSRRWPLQVMFVDELARLIDPTLQGKPYVDRFLAAAKDVLNTGAKTGFVLVATCTNPRASVLTEGLRDQFTITLAFRTRDHHASAVAVGKVAPGYEPHLLPKQAGRCVFIGDEVTHLRTYRIWDQAAADVVRNLTSGPVQSWPPPAPGTAYGPDALIKTINPIESVNKSDSGPRKLTRGEPRDLILVHLQTYGPKSVLEVSQELGIPRSTVKRWMLGGDNCTDPLPLQKVGQHRYQLIGGTR
jgi:hypothetical protein